MQTYYYVAPFGPLKLTFDGATLFSLEFYFDDAVHSTKLPKEAVPYFDALDAYFSGSLKTFNLPLQVRGTEFQKKVWSQIAAIPYGESCSYKDIALVIDNHPRAVGQACGRNNLPIFIPCHRVLGKSGLGGFNLGSTDATLDIKRWLLQHEGVSW